MMHRRFRWFTLVAMHSIFLRRITSHTGRMRPVGLEKRSFAVCFGDQLSSYFSFSEENKICFPLKTHGVHSESG